MDDDLASENSFFGSNLFYMEDYCPYCDYEGPLDPRRDGYRCPECRELVLPNE